MSDKYKDRFFPVFGWVAYDFANTIFSAVMVSFFFTAYVKELTGRDAWVGSANTVSMILAAFAVPVFGCMVDRSNCSKKGLLILTLICCAATAAITFIPSVPENVMWMMLLFVVANFCYQATLVFYDTLLADVATKKNVGLISGIGVGAGYVGTIAALYALLPVKENYGIEYTFIGCAIMFAVLTLPLAFFVRERKVEAPSKITMRLAAGSIRETFALIKNLPSEKPVMLFLIGNFLCSDALNTLIIFSRNTIEGFFGYGDAELVTIFSGLLVAALVAGCLTGKLSDKWGAKPVYLLSAGSLILSLAVCLAASYGEPAIFLIAFIGLGSIGLAGIWTAGRALVLELVPEERAGRYFGFYGITQKLSVIGAITYGFIADAAGYRLAVVLLLALLVPGFFFILKVKTPNTKAAS
jgi:UMF1 family MFS transporter